ncbi:MAG: hypothetical protein KAV87_68185, partial [Desulfobacteraceae bacterium]|nr:hypothetical protein [Desulfobacteraceae bacterium]
NQTVKDTQSSGMIQDLAKIQRGNPMFKLFTNFYSYFSATYNLNVEAYRKTSFKSPSEVAMMLSDMVIINVMPALFGAALRELLKNECEGEMECLMEKYAEEQVSFILAMTIPSREMGAGLGALVGLETFDYKGPAGLRPFADIYSLQVQTSQGEMDKAWMKAANKVAGSILHYPAGQINQTVEGMMAIESGEVEGAGAVRALLTGPPRK